MPQEQKTIQELLNFSIINLDKPTGPTSFSVSDHVRKSLNLKKTSHFGTLDPAVTGVLPIALGRACRLNEYFMHRNKVYMGIMRLHKEVNEEDLKKTISKFLGKIKQLPPVRSNVKREVRERSVFSFKILEREGKDILFETEVQAGTYIRKLCDDMGKDIGGAHMSELRRTSAGIFSETDKNFVSLYQLEEAINKLKERDESLIREILIPAEEAIKKVLPFFQISKKANIKPLLTGKPLLKTDIEFQPDDEKFALFSDKQLIGIYKKFDNSEFVAKPEFVFN